MSTIIDPLSYNKEERVNIPASGVDCVVISGYANYFDGYLDSGAPLAPTGNALVGDLNDDDKLWILYTTNLIVGPNWRDVRDVSPIVTIAGFSFGDSDSADASGTQIESCTWDTVGLPEGQTDFERIRLKVELRLCGGIEYLINKLAYHLVAVGRL